MKVAILDDWFDTLKKLPCFEKLKGLDVTIFNDHEEDVNQLAKRLKPFDVLVLFRERTAITAELLEKLPNLKLISQRSVYPHIDVEACNRKGVLLCSNMHSGTPSYAAAEHTWALIMSSMRQIPQQMANMQMGGWQMGVGKTLRGRTLGLYGYGRIAKTVAKYADAFGMQVIWWGSKSGRENARSDGHTIAANRNAFFATSDIVSIHVRLKPTTQNLITANDLGCMQKDALFINTSRAGIIEKDAVLYALNEGRPGSAALDVFDQEPITWSNDPLANHPNIICTPHIGFVTEDEFELQFSDIFDQIVAYNLGNPINMINEVVWHV